MGIFGPSRKEIWTKLSGQIDARYVDGGWWKSDRVEVAHGGWTVTLDTFVVPAGETVLVFTRMRAPFVNPSGFRFTVYRQSIFSGIAKAFGMQDIEVGDPPFDDGFIIQANQESRVRELLGHGRIRDLIAKQKDINFQIKDNEGWGGTPFPPDVDELYFSVGGIIKDPERLKLLYDLFAETLDALCRIGAAADRPPAVKVT